MSTILKCENLVKTYGIKDNKVTAVNDISLSFEEGQFTAVIGRSGSGKSTLLHMLAGLIRPDSGEVLLEEKPLFKMNDRELTILRRRKIGIIFQFFNLISSENVQENVVLPVYLDGKKPDMEYVDEILEMLGLSEKKSAFPYELSGGQQQRAAIARALAARPAVIFADEPTGNLDAKSSAEVISLLRETQQKYHQTVVMVTHDVSIAETADRVIVLEDGKVVEDRLKQ